MYLIDDEACYTPICEELVEDTDEGLWLNEFLPHEVDHAQIGIAPR